ncbi:hypothetical protein DFJ73DRAFT_828490 [Zopfochytrium polystomum]|nr:hypothetical protein DFJ73DRAFT_828490 [Zopfochytrium polystomum]
MQLLLLLLLARHPRAKAALLHHLLDRRHCRRHGHRRQLLLLLRLLLLVLRSDPSSPLPHRLPLPRRETPTIRSSSTSTIRDGGATVRPNSAEASALEKVRSPTGF